MKGTAYGVPLHVRDGRSATVLSRVPIAAGAGAGRYDEAFIQQIAFDNPSERYASLIGGTVDALLEQPGDVRNFVDAGQMQPILTFFNERPDLFADVPTHLEVGASFEPMLRFRGFWTHADTPPERVALLEDACSRAFNTEDYQDFNARGFMDVVDSYRSSDAFRQMIETEIVLYTEAFEQAGL